MHNVRIGEAEFNPLSRDIICPDGKKHRLRPQSALLLETLLAHPETIRSKTDLMDAVWGDICVTEDSLKQCVTDIRKALGVSRECLQTVPRVGYRFMNPNPVDAISRSIKPNSLPQGSIKYANSTDGIKLAWTSSGQGLPLLKAPSWISNIEMETRSLIFAPLYDRLGVHARVVRFDQRGTSLSSQVQGELSVEQMVQDILAVADAAELDKFVLYGPSQGVAFSIAFAHRYPERVLGIIGRGGFAKGWLATGCEIQRQKYEASRALIEAGWHAENPEYRRFFTARLIPNASPEIATEFDEMQRRAVDSPSMLANLELMCSLDVEREARAINCPVLLIHSRGDRAVDIAEGNKLAAMISNAEFTVLDDDNHIFLPATIGFEQAVTSMEGFLDRFKSV